MTTTTVFYVTLGCETVFLDYCLMMNYNSNYRLDPIVKRLRSHESPVAIGNHVITVDPARQRVVNEKYTNW